MSRLNHTFSVDHAEKYGIECAILIHHFQFWIEQNQAMGKNFIEGRTWTFQTQNEISAIYPYWNRDQVQGILQKLVDFEIIIKGKFNKSKLNHTQWFAFKDEKMFTKVRNCTNDGAESHNARCEIAQSIRKDTKSTDTKKTTTAPLAPNAAVSSEKEKKPDKAKVIVKPTPHEIKRSIPYVYDGLNKIEIPHGDKVWISKNFDGPTIEHSIAWATHPQTQVKQSLAQALKWACKEKPQIPVTKMQLEAENRIYAMNLQKKMKKENPSFVYNENLQRLSKGKAFQKDTFDLTLKYVEICTAPFQPKILEYDNKNFKKLLHENLKKHGFEE